MRRNTVALVASLFACAGAGAVPDGPYRDADPAALARQTLEHASPTVLEAIEAGLEVEFARPQALIEYGYGEALAGRGTTARDSYRQALELAPDAAGQRRVRWSFGWALLHLDAHDEAIAQWRQAVMLHGGRPFWFPYSMAVAQWMAGREDEALRWYQIAVDSHPGRWGNEAAMRIVTRHWKPREKAAVEAVFAAWNGRADRTVAGDTALR